MLAGLQCVGLIHPSGDGGCPMWCWHSNTELLAQWLVVRCVLCNVQCASHTHPNLFLAKTETPGGAMPRVRIVEISSGQLASQAGKSWGRAGKS